MGQRISWAIVGSGTIAAKMARDMGDFPDAQLAAIVSRSADRAQAAAKSFGAHRWSTDLSDLLKEGLIDAVYIATPHSSHFDAVMTCLDHGVPVLCEKPLTVNYHLAREIVEAARSRQVLVMEALRTMFHPLLRQLWDYLDHGFLGSVRSMRLEMGFAANFDPDNRLFNPKLGGGSTLDLGIYPLSLPLAFWGEPTKIEVVGQAVSTGVDAAGQTILSFAGGGMASIESSIVYPMENSAQIFGSKGRVKVEPPWYSPRKITVIPLEGKQEVWVHRSRGNGLRYELEHFHKLIRSGAKESHYHPLDNTLLLSKVMDRIMASI